MGSFSNDYIINFKINLEDDRPEKILEEFNQNIGYVDNICDFMTSIKKIKMPG